MPKFCRDCKYISVPTPGAFDLAKCHHKSAVKPNIETLVSGKGEDPDWLYASTCRGSERDVMCGPEGRHWEKK